MQCTLFAKKICLSLQFLLRMHDFKIYVKSNNFLNAFKVLLFLFRTAKNFSYLKDTCKHARFIYFFILARFGKSFERMIKMKENREKLSEKNLNSSNIFIFRRFRLFKNSLKLRHKLHLYFL